MHHYNKKLISFLIVTCCGIGKIPFAPGTFGSIYAFAIEFTIEYIIIHYFHSNYDIFFVLMISRITLLVFFVVTGWYATKKYLQYTDQKDPKEVVVDELVGQLLTNIGVCFSPIFILAAFPNINIFLLKFLFSFFLPLFLFRFFDILKPWPIKAIENLEGAAGVMLDDIIASIFAIIVNYALIFTIIDYCR